MSTGSVGVERWEGVSESEGQTRRELSVFLFYTGLLLWQKDLDDWSRAPFLITSC